LADDAASQAILSSGDEEDEEAVVHLHQMDASQMEAPQLVMPSINMPSRRPFTERGMEIGKLKILLAGSKGRLHRLLLACNVERITDLFPLFTQARASLL